MEKDLKIYIGVVAVVVGIICILKVKKEKEYNKHFASIQDDKI